MHGGLNGGAGVRESAASKEFAVLGNDRAQATTAG